MRRSFYSKVEIIFEDVKVYCEYILNGKPPIVLIHGFVSSIYTFNRLIPLLENHYSIIALDLPGFGKIKNQPHLYIRMKTMLSWLPIVLNISA